MLISFSVSNWKSIRDEATLSMMAGREDRFRERLPYFNKLDVRILPITAIYGANASGKSVLISAMEFAKRFILFGTELEAPIGIKPFLLDDESFTKPSSFVFAISIQDEVYEYSFTLSQAKVLRESLNRVLKTTTQTVFERTQGKNKPEISIHKVPKEHKKELNLLASLSVRENQLFLTSIIYLGYNYFQNIYDWFKYKLMIITPDMYYRPILDLAKEENKQLYSNLLEALDTGIVDLTLSHEVVSGKEAQELRELFREELQGAKILMIESARNDRRVIELSQDSVVVKSLTPKHLAKNSKLVDFSFSMESDGTNRLLDILPAFVLLSTQQDYTVIIDELDRSLHTKLTKTLLEFYLYNCNPDSRNQLIFTTHDVMLMDQNLLRRDEFYIIERDYGGASSLFCISQYKDIRYDHDIRKSYLQGNLGGIPSVSTSELCNTL
ncbi:MAG: ATP-binding protein [Candidatus Cloacimonetes bacterium]|nr:ATP-binding protein [Candidatus Cloacimonadota bacterium]